MPSPIKAIATLVKGKAPIVAIPVEGHAPICVDRRRLAGWTKGVTITSVEVEPFGPEYTFDKPSTVYVGWCRQQPEGPENRIVHINGGCWIKLSGTAANGRIKTSCKIVAVARTIAIRDLSKWAEKERIKLNKTRMLGVLGEGKARTTAVRKLKLMAMEDGSDETVAVSVAMPDTKERCLTCGYATNQRSKCKELGHEIQPPQSAPRVDRMGMPISIPEMPELQFALVKFAEADGPISFTVTELVTGKQVGSGATAQEAIVDARTMLGKISPGKRSDMTAGILAGRNTAA